MTDEASNSESSDLIVLDTLSDEEAIPTVVVKSDSENNSPNDTLNNSINNHCESPVPSASNGKPPPLVQLIFRNKNLAEHCMKDVEALIRNALRHNPRYNHLEQEETQLEIHHEFSLDTQPTGDQDDGMPQEIPLYTISHESFLQEEKENVDEPDGSPAPNKRKMTCFNCDGDHIVSKCPIQLDHRRIQRNRKSMGANGTPKSGNRYHLDGTSLKDAARADFVPGIISKELSAALGLRPHQLPSYIYRMRVLGYPPGWLKEAEIETSGLTIYDSAGRAVALNEEEDGEVDGNETRVQHDPSKLVNYVGFNTVLPPNMVDEHYLYQMPSFQFHQLRSEAEKTMKTNPAQPPYRKRKFPTDLSNSSKSKDAKVEDMEIEAIEGTIVIESDEDDDCKFIPPLPRESPPPPPQDVEASNSPSLSDLEAAKQQIMQELENPEPSTPRTKPTRSLSVTPGTPVLYDHSPFDTLPESSKFAEGVSDYLPFENLPDSTGVYEKMRGVLTKVRKAYTSL